MSENAIEKYYNEIKEAVPYGATYLRITEMSELK